MTWIRRVDPEPAAHRCDVPMREVVYQLPPPIHDPDAPRRAWQTTIVDGSDGDLWRCDDCGLLWRVGPACDPCDRSGGCRPHGGHHMLGQRWRVASRWQQFRYRRSR